MVAENPQELKQERGGVGTCAEPRCLNFDLSAVNFYLTSLNKLLICIPTASKPVNLPKNRISEGLGQGLGLPV